MGREKQKPQFDCRTYDMNTPIVQVRTYKADEAVGRRTAAQAPCKRSRKRVACSVSSRWPNRVANRT